MLFANGLYGLVGDFSNSGANLIILITLVLVVVVVYYRYKKLLITMIFAFFIASLYLANYYPKKVYSKNNFSVFSNGSYMYLNVIDRGELEYTLYSKKGNIIEVGNYDEGHFEPYYDYKNASYNFFADVFIIDILLIILYLILFLKEDFIRFRDFKRNIKLIPFSYRSEEEKFKILKENLYCKSCNSKEIMSLEKEIYSKGMHMLHLKCRVCKNVVKERISL